LAGASGPGVVTFLLVTIAAPRFDDGFNFGKQNASQFDYCHAKGLKGRWIL
jgi:hypothetical protein